MLHISQSALQQLRSLLEEKPAGSGLRLSVERGGCAGMQYGMEIGERQTDDREFGEPGASVLVDPASFEFLDGVTLDYVDELTGSGFKIINPRATRSCGCGTSFEPDQSASAAHA